MVPVLGDGNVVVDTRRVKRGNFVNLCTLRITTVSAFLLMTATLPLIAMLTMSSLCASQVSEGSVANPNQPPDNLIKIN